MWQHACNPMKPEMLKITLHDTAAEFRIRLEGRLSGAWVTELRQCWVTASSTTNGRSTIVDLHDVDFVDEAGQNLLAEMHGQGVELAASTPLIQGMVEESCAVLPCGRVEEQAKPRRNALFCPNAARSPS